MLFDALVACLVIGRLAGGRVHRLATIPLRHSWLFVVGFAGQLLILVPALSAASGWIHILSYAPLFAGVAVNFHIRELWIAALGLALNFSVIAANGGKMPTSAEAIRRIGRPGLIRYLQQGRHPRNVLITRRTWLPLLGDRFVLPPPYPRATVFSAGDVLLTVSICALVLRGMGAFGLGRSAEPSPKAR